MNSIGSQLKDARTKKTLSFEEIHAKTKIHPRVLQLLEEDKFEKLPSPLFVKSFLKSYAEFLEINPEGILQAYEKEGNKEPEQVLYIQSVDQKEGSVNVSRDVLPMVKYALAALLVLVLGFFLFKIIGRSLSSIHWGHRTNKTAKSAVVKPAAAKPKLAPAAPAKTPEAKKESQWLCSVEQGNFPKLGARTPLDLRIRALDSVWVKISSDGKVLFQGVLKKGSAESWTAKESIEIQTGIAANMFLTLNKTPLGSPGKGKVRRMTLTHKGIRAVVS